jgi:hypothetical protein
MALRSAAASAAYFVGTMPVISGVGYIRIKHGFPHNGGLEVSS